MKLRLRSVETKETLRIEVPTTCSLHQLKEIIAQRLPCKPSSVHLSLNRKDELFDSSPDEQDNLQSHGITSGDLIFFTTNPNIFSSPTRRTHHSGDHRSLLRLSRISENMPVSDHQLNKDQTLCSQSLDLNIPMEDSTDFDSKNGEAIGNMEVDGGAMPVADLGKSFSIPGFLRKVFSKELGDHDGGRDHKLIVVAVHAVLLESGFLEFDPASNRTISGFVFSKLWPSLAFNMSLPYTLPEIAGHGGDNSKRIDHVVLKFQTLGRFINVYGSLAGGSATRRVVLDESSLVPFLNVAWANCGLTDAISEENGFPCTTPEKEVFMFWKTVKDMLVLPLLIDLCEKSRLPLPPCFMWLPTDLKRKIFESLPAIDLAKVCCLCWETRYLASTDDLWKQKFTEEFGEEINSTGNDIRSSWKDMFANAWRARQKEKTAVLVSLPVIHYDLPLLAGEHAALPRVRLGIFPHALSRSGIRFLNILPPCHLRGNQ